MDKVSGTEDSKQIVILATPGLVQLTHESFVFECATTIEFFIWMTELSKVC